MAVPIERQVLLLTGKANFRMENMAKQALSIELSSNQRICFIMFAYEDVPIGSQYEMVFPSHSVDQGIESTVVVTAVTQQFWRPLDVIPRGWKTITVLTFPNSVPQLIDDLPVIDNWYDSETYVCLSTKETWQTLINNNRLSI